MGSQGGAPITVKQQPRHTDFGYFGNPLHVFKKNQEYLKLGPEWPRPIISVPCFDIFMDPTIAKLTFSKSDRVTVIGGPPGRQFTGACVLNPYATNRRLNYDVCVSQTREFANVV